MSYKIHNTKDWPLSKLQPYGAGILQALRKIARRYKEDISLELLAKEILNGDRVLWLILKDQHFKALFTTRIEENLVGKKCLWILELAGQGGLSLTEIYKELEGYARAQSISQIAILGRFGWARRLRKLGYVPFMAQYKKDILNDS